MFLNESDKDIVATYWHNDAPAERVYVKNLLIRFEDWNLMLDKMSPVTNITSLKRGIETLRHPVTLWGNIFLLEILKPDWK